MHHNDHPIFLVYCPCKDFEEARLIGQTLISEHLAGCCNIIPKILSIYSWQGKLQEDEETLLLVKTTKEKYPSIEARIKDLHSYECPAIIGFQSGSNSKDFHSWLCNQLSP